MALHESGRTTTCPDTGATLKWCPHHGNGAYMPADHNHTECAEKKKRRQTENEEKHAAKRSKFLSSDGSPKSSTEKPTKDEKHPSQLQLSSLRCQSLVTHCCMTPSEAEELIKQTYGDAGKEERGRVKRVGPEQEGSTVKHAV